jgi:hypothetical protein
LNHFSERIKIYNEERFDYKLYKMEIKWHDNQHIDTAQS